MEKESTDEFQLSQLKTAMSSITVPDVPKSKWFESNILIYLSVFLPIFTPIGAIVPLLLIWLRFRRDKDRIQPYKDIAKKISTQGNELFANIVAHINASIGPLDTSIRRRKLKIEALDKKIEEKDSIVKEAIAKAWADLENESKELKAENAALSKELEDKQALKDKIITEGKQIVLQETLDLQEELETKRNEISALTAQNELLDQQISVKKGRIVELDDEALMQDFALYKPQYSFINAESYKVQLDKIRNDQKQQIKNQTAATGNTGLTVNDSKSEGRKLVRDTQKLLLRAFNSECEHVTGKVKYNNFESCEKRIINSYNAISKLGRIMNISISANYFDLKIQELRLALEYQLKKQEEKEHQRELREQAREEAQLRKEIAEARKKIVKEQTHYSHALEKVKEQLMLTTDEAERKALQEKASELESQLTEIQKNIENIDYRESNQKAGYVYIISNIGSFGQGIYKIGMTRRLDPMERVYELGDASVPFNFDVHAMIFSDDAPRLETALHHAFEERKINMVNTRREFFKVSLDEIEKVVKEHYDGTVEFIKVPDAIQYRESEKMRQTLA